MGINSTVKSIGTTVGNFRTFLILGVSAIWKAFDIRDLLVFGGLFSLSYGFYSLFSWLGWIALGGVSMLLGLGWIVRRPKT